ncbi:MAG: phosphomannomutase/phosphoglucomutase [Methylococcales bacterium]|nr:phosphomannomutase/phosphoglucomutase [Methylococcales bacterium]
MGRIFSLLAVQAVVVVLIAGGGTLLLCQSDISQAKQQSTEALAKSLAQSLSNQVAILNTAVSKMAKSADVIAVAETNDVVEMAKTASLLEQFLPKAMKIRLLPATINELDTSSIPHMGNADLIMVQETLSHNQFPVVQGQGRNRHLAITAVIKNNDSAVGVILASLNVDFLKSTLKNSQFINGFIELRQDKAILAQVGKTENKTSSAKQIKIAQTPWIIDYWPIKTTDIASLSIFIILISVSALSVCLILFINYKHLTSTLIKDQRNVLKVIKDLMAGKNVGSYPVKLKEIKTIIPTIIQFQRSLDNIAVSEPIDLDSNEFFPASTDEDKPEEAPAFNINSDSDIVIKDEASSPTIISEIEVSSDKTPTHASKHSSPVPNNSSPTIFKAYDIRGIAGKTLTKEIAFDIGRAIGSEVKQQHIKSIVVGRDGRTSSPILTKALSKGIISTGVNIIDIGLVPTPVVYFVTQHTEGKSGVMVTGGHNPTEYNGFTVIINGKTLASGKIKALQQRIATKAFMTSETEGSIEANNMFINEYIGTIAEDIHIERPMKIVIDCGNGAAGKLAPVLFKTLGCEVIELFCDINGSFPNHHPDPSNPKNLADLIRAVKEHNADVGIAFDGAGNRLGVVDSKGKIIWADRQMMLFAKDVLASKPSTEIIYDVKCSRHLAAEISKSGGRPLMWRTGHSFIKARLKESGAALAGEMSGHIFFNDRWFGFDDALYSASRLIEILSADSRNSNEVFADFPDSINTPEINIQLPEGQNIAFMEKLTPIANFKGGKIIDIDGLRIEFSDGWGLIRASNTMPFLVLRFETDNKEALIRIQSQFKKLLTKVRPDLKIPF